MANVVLPGECTQERALQEGGWWKPLERLD